MEDVVAHFYGSNFKSEIPDHRRDDRPIFSISNLDFKFEISDLRFCFRRIGERLPFIFGLEHLGECIRPFPLLVAIPGGRAQPPLPFDGRILEIGRPSAQLPGAGLRRGFQI